jgi:hypothetical protein
MPSAIIQMLLFSASVQIDDMDDMDDMDHIHILIYIH